MARELTPKDVFDHVVGKTANERASGFGRRDPVSEAPRGMPSLRVRQEIIEELIDEGTDEGYIGLAVGFSNGSGVGMIDRKGDCLVEAY